jgi:hypothetical protein
MPDGRTIDLARLSGLPLLAGLLLLRPARTH